MKILFFQLLSRIGQGIILLNSAALEDNFSSNLSTFLMFHHKSPELIYYTYSDFAPLALETYGGTSENFDKAAEFNNIPYPILLNYWKKRISTVLQIGNVSIISEAYRRLFNFGAETLQRDYDLERAFN